MTVRKENNTWTVDVSSGKRAIDGKRNRHKKFGFATKREAEEYETNYKVTKLKQITYKNVLTVGMLYELTKQEDVRRENRMATIDTQYSYYTQYISVFFENADMKMVDIEDVLDFREWLRKKSSKKGGTLAEVTVNRQMIFLGKMFECAIKAKFRTDNPCKLIRKLSQSRTEFEYYTPQMFKRFDLLFGPDEYRFQLYFRILMYSGVRSGEALALTWKQVNFKDDYLDIKYTVCYKNKEMTFRPVKTKESKRRVYIHKSFIEELKDWKNRQSEILGGFIDDVDNLQVLQTTPEYLTEPNVTNFRRDKLKKRLPIDLPYIRNHDFRHSHAAYLISDGLRKGEGKDYLFFMLMKRLGHTSITTTINTYSHLFPSEQKEVANAFDNF